jgi:hypothetical protein
MAELDIDLAEMARRVKEVGDNFNFTAKIVRDFAAGSTLRPMIVNLTQARQLLKESGNNLKVVQTALKAANVPAKDMQLLMSKLSGELGKARKEALGFGAALGTWSTRQMDIALRNMRAFQDAGKKGMGTAGSALKYGAYGAAVGAAYTGMQGVEKIIETASFREASIKGLEYTLGKREISASMSLEKANEQRALNAKAEADTADLFAEGLKLAQQTPIADREIMQALKDFVVQGYKPREAKFLAKVMADQQSKFLEDPRVRENFVTAASRMQGRGIATNRDLESLRIAKFKTSDIIANLVNQPGVAEIMQGYKAGKYKVDEKDIQQVFDEELGHDVTKVEAEAIVKLKKILSSGLIQSSTLLNAAIASNYPGERLEEAAGQLAKLKAESTLPGAISNAANTLENLLLGIKWEDNPGVKALRDFLNQYTRLVSHSEKLKGSVEGIVNALFEPLARIKDTDFEAIIDSVAKVGEKLVGFLHEAWDWFYRLIHAEPGTLLDSILGTLIDIGKYIGAGIWEGVKSSGSVIEEYQAKKKAISDARDKATSVELAKPFWEEATSGFSQVSLANRKAVGEEELTASEQAASDFDEWAAQVAQSGKSFADGGVVPGPMGAPQLIVAHGGERFQGVNNRNPSGGGGGLVIQGPLFVVNGDVKDPDALGAAIKPLVQEELANVWHRLAMEQG